MMDPGHETVKPYFQREALPEVLKTADLGHAENRIRIKGSES